MKRLLLFSAMLLCLSCSTDGGSDSANSKLVRKATNTTYGHAYTFAYNTDKTVHSITSSLGGDPLGNVVSFAYQDGRIASIEIVRANGSELTTFDYNANGKITGVTTANVYRAVTYNAADNSYLTTSPDDGMPMRFYLDADGDIRGIVQMNPNIETAATLEFDTEHYGTLYNSTPVALHIYLIKPIHIWKFAPLFSSLPVASMAFNQYVEYNNTYDSQGFIIRSDGFDDYIFDYTQQ